MTETETKEQKVFSSQYVERLYMDLVETQDISDYEMDFFPYKEDYPKGGTDIVIPEDIALIMPDGRDLKDLENTKIIFEAYRSLTPTQASDMRLWTYLTHVTYWDYMKVRWPLGDAKKPLNRICDRYFLRSLNLETLTPQRIVPVVVVRLFNL